MVLYTMSKEHEDFTVRRLKNQNISYMIQEISTNKINLFLVNPNVWKLCDILSLVL